MSYELYHPSEEQELLRERLELPESVELLQRELPTHSEAQQSTEILSPGLELDIRTRELPERQESPYRYSDAYIDPEGKYRPQSITGIYADALEDPEVDALASELHRWEMQEKINSCGIQVQRMIIGDKAGIDVSESELRKKSQEQGWYSTETGTYTKDLGKLAEQYGLEREVLKGVDIEELRQLKAQGADLIVCLDQVLLERPYLDKPAVSNHVVEVIGFDDSNPEDLKVIINDPGRISGCGAAYSLSMFERAAYSTDPDTGKTGIRTVVAIYDKEAGK